MNLKRAIGATVVLALTAGLFGTYAPAQSIEDLQQEIAELKASLNEVREFNKRLCRALREESIIVFASTPKTPEEKVDRALEQFKASVDKAQAAMASRNPQLHERAETMKKAAQEEMKKLDPKMVVPALKAEIEASSDNFLVCSSLMMALGQVGGKEVLPYFQNICEDSKRPGFVRRIGAEALLAVDKAKAIEVLMPVASDFEAKNFPERFYVIYMLSETKDPAVEPLLVKGAKQDPDKSARCHHINGLAHYKTAEARATLEWVIANDEYEHARTNALASLHRMLGDEAAYELMKKYSKQAKLKGGGPDYRVRNAAYQTMNRIKMTLEREGKPVPGEAPKEPAGDAAAPPAKK